MIDRTLQRLSREEQEREGRDTPADLDPHAIRVLVNQLLAMGCDVEPHSDVDLDCDCVSVTCDQESADDVIGMHGGARETLPGGYLTRISWPEAPWPITGKELAALWGNDND
tara:strand:+ start:60 stop:395 length:336 start_codon:yes stop_codon:yes gene_type:complete